MATPRTGNPRGRPPGAKNKPKTVEAFVIEALTASPVSPPRKPKLKARGPWANKTPEERRALSLRLNAGRDLSKNGQGGRPGIDPRLTNAQHAQIVADAQPEIKRIMKKMADQGILPDDPRAVQALETAVTLLKTESAKDRLAAARLVLDFTKSKPTTKIETTIKTAEDFLDEIDND